MTKCPYCSRPLAGELCPAHGFVGRQVLKQALGPVGATGATGASGVAGKLPSSYAELAAPVSTVSATFETTGVETTITLDEVVEIACMCSFEVATQSGASASTIEVCYEIDSVQHDPHARYLSGSNDVGIGAIVHRTGELAAGTYTVKLLFRRVSGVSTPGLNSADMLVMAMQGAKGATGAAGPAVADGDKGDIVVSSGGTIWTVDSLAITDAKVAAENKDGAYNVASMRTLGTGASQAAAGSHGHSLAVVFPIASASTLYSPADDAVWFLGSGNLATATATWVTCRPFVLPTTMSLTHAYVYWNGTTAAGSGEDISAYVRINDTTDYLIGTVGTTAATKTFSNTALGGGVLTAGTQFAVKIVCPTWATNPTGVYVLGTIQWTDATT